MPLPNGLLERFIDGIPPEHRFFIETGTHRGDGVQQALDAGIDTVYSCDVSPFAHGWACHRFRAQRDKVNLLLMDSRAFLKQVMRFADPQAIVFLDAHWCGGNGEVEGNDGGDQQDNPLTSELHAIYKAGKHPTLLIDDRRLMGSEAGWPTEKEVRARVLKINPSYAFQLADSSTYPDDILIARIA